MRSSVSEGSSTVKLRATPAASGKRRRTPWPRLWKVPPETRWQRASASPAARASIPDAARRVKVSSRTDSGRAPDLDEPRHAVDERTRLPRPRARDDEQRAFRRRHGAVLRLVQLLLVVDAVRARQARDAPQDEPPLDGLRRRRLPEFEAALEGFEFGRQLLHRAVAILRRAVERLRRGRRQVRAAASTAARRAGAAPRAGWRASCRCGCRPRTGTRPSASRRGRRRTRRRRSANRRAGRAVARATCS